MSELKAATFCQQILKLLEANFELSKPVVKYFQSLALRLIWALESKR